MKADSGGRLPAAIGSERGLIVAVEQIGLLGIVLIAFVNDVRKQVDLVAMPDGFAKLVEYLRDPIGTYQSDRFVP